MNAARDQARRPSWQLVLLGGAATALSATLALLPEDARAASPAPAPPARRVTAPGPALEQRVPAGGIAPRTAAVIQPLLPAAVLHGAAPPDPAPAEPTAEQLEVTEPAASLRAARPGRHAALATRLGWPANDPRTARLERWMTETSADRERARLELVELFGATDAALIALDVESSAQPLLEAEPLPRER